MRHSQGKRERVHGTTTKHRLMPRLTTAPSQETWLLHSHTCSCYHGENSVERLIVVMPMVQDWLVPSVSGLSASKSIDKVYLKGLEIYTSWSRERKQFAQVEGGCTIGLMVLNPRIHSPSKHCINLYSVSSVLIGEGNTKDHAILTSRSLTRSNSAHHKNSNGRNRTAQTRPDPVSRRSECSLHP